jgi:hypothetical protein
MYIWAIMDMDIFDPNDVVMWSKDASGRPWSVEYTWTDGHARPVGTTLIVKGDRQAEVPLEELRPLKWREFIWFKHPRTGAWMSGKTRGYMAVIIHLFSMMLTGAAHGQSFSWWGLLGLLPVGGYWLGTRNNYTGRWV